jgi:hypothetical protein
VVDKRPYEVGKPVPTPEKASSLRWPLLVLALLSLLLLVLAVRCLGTGGQAPQRGLLAPTPVPPTSAPETLFLTAEPAGTARATYTPFPTRTSLPPTPTRTTGPTREMYVTPVLLEPALGSAVSGRTVRLRWHWPGQLQEDEWFDVWLWPRGEGELSMHWTKSNEHDLDLPGGIGVYFWKVRIVRGMPGKPEPVAVSPWSETRSFDYRGVAVPPTTGPTVGLPTSTPPGGLPAPATRTPAPPTPTTILPTDTPVSPTDTAVLPASTSLLPRLTPTGG